MRSEEEEEEAARRVAALHVIVMAGRTERAGSVESGLMSAIGPAIELGELRERELTARSGAAA